MKIFHGKNFKIKNRRTTTVESGVTFGNDVTVGQCCQILGQTKIGNGCYVGDGCYLKDCIIHDGVKIEKSYLEGAEIFDNVSIGPFARIRPKSTVGENSKIGNFVEIKNSVLGKGVKVSHLAYVGDAEIGKNTNVGCGVVFANYDGKNKNKTVIGKNCFIGSNTNLIAPLSVGDGAFISAGATVTEDVESKAFVVARARQIQKPNGAIKYNGDL